MDQYFTTQQGAIRRLIAIKRGSAGGSHLSTIVGKRKDGTEVTGVAGVLSAVRAGRVACYIHTCSADRHVVFVT